MIKKIESAQNKLYKNWKKLHRRKDRKQQRTMLIEGEHLLKEAVLSKQPILAWITLEEKVDHLYAQNWFVSGKAPHYVLPPKLFATLTQTETSQGLLAEVSLPDWSEQQLLAGHTTLLLDEVQDPGNLGTMIRTAEATRTDGIWLGQGSVDPTNSKVVRAAMGSSFRLPLIQTDLKKLIPRLQKQGVKVVSTSPRATTVYHQLKFPQKVAFLLGNEGRGIHPELVSLVDEEVVLPMWGHTESLNVSVTAAVLLYERIRQLETSVLDKSE